MKAKFIIDDGNVGTESEPDTILKAKFDVSDSDSDYDSDSDSDDDYECCPTDVSDDDYECCPKRNTPILTPKLPKSNEIQIDTCVDKRYHYKYETDPTDSTFLNYETKNKYIKLNCGNQKDYWERIENVCNRDKEYHEKMFPNIFNKPVTFPR